MLIAFLGLWVRQFQNNIFADAHSPADRARQGDSVVPFHILKPVVTRLLLIERDFFDLPSFIRFHISKDDDPQGYRP